jgi:signal transduction histidine kinase
MMPDIDGFEVCQRIKANNQWQHIPIILVTALAGKKDLARGIEAGADDFVHKPVHNLELRSRVRSMLRIKKQYDAMQSTMRLREDMAQMIAHDMRTPLNVISGYCDLMLGRDITPPENLKDLEKIRFQTEHMNQFLNDMLILAKMEANQLIISPTSVNISQIVKKIEESHSVLVQSKNIRLQINLPETSQPVSIDSSLFERALDNLVSNALKFSPDDSTVTIEVEHSNLQTPDAQFCIKVMDEGPGIPQEYRERIFEKFEIIPIQQNDLSQIGLGLTFCKMAVEAHKGRISVEDNYPTGSIFVIEI